jgi:hypothetical protein
MMFTGKQPFDEDNVAKLVHDITTNEPDMNDPCFAEVS